MPKKPANPPPPRTPDKPPKKASPKKDPARALAEKHLAKACSDSDLATAASLLKQHPDLAEDSQPLLNAAFAGADKIVRLLLDAGADPNAASKTSGHLRPLHRICEGKKTIPKHEGHFASLKLLLEADADPTIRAGHFRTTPLTMAAMAPYPDFIEPLLKKMGPEGGDIFHAAVLGDLPRVQALLKEDKHLALRADINGMTALMYAGASRLSATDKLTARNLTTIADLLLHSGADVNATALFGETTWTPLSFSIPNPAILKRLLDAGADTSKALINALWSADYDTAALLVDYGANPKDPAIAQYVGIFAHWGHFTQSRWLIERGSPVDATGEPGSKIESTALHSAAKRGAKGDFLEFLLENNADPLRKTSDGKTALDLASDNNKTKLLPILQVAMDRAHLHAMGKDTTEDDEFEADLPAHMRSKRQGR